MFENRRFPTEFERIGPFDPMDYTAAVPLGNNDATELKGKIYDTQVGTFLYRARGRIVELPGKYRHGNPYSPMTSYPGGDQH